MQRMIIQPKCAFNTSAAKKACVRKKVAGYQVTGGEEVDQGPGTPAPAVFGT